VLQQGQPAPANPTGTPTLIKPWEADEDTPTSKLCGMVKRPGVQSVSGNIVESTDIKNSILLLSHDEKEDVLTAYARQPWFVMADIETLQRVVREDDTATPEDVVAVDAELATFVGALASSEDEGAARVALKRLRTFIRSLSRERPGETPEKKLTLLERHWSEDADAFADKFKRKWTRLCFCDIMVTEMRKRWWLRPTLGCVICNDRKAGSWYRIKGCLNWVHEECGDRWRQERRLQGMTPMCPYGACYKGAHEMRCWLQQ